MRAFFDGTRPGRAVALGGMQFELPALYFRDDSFQAMFTADLAQLRVVMPSDRLHPVVVAPGRVPAIGRADEAVVLDLVVGADGRARDIKVVTGLPHGLSQAAVAALRACRFTPGERAGVPVPVRVREFKIRFFLQED